MAEGEQESLVSGLSALTKFASMQDTVGSLYNEFNDLIQQCQTLKAKQQTLAMENEKESARLQSIRAEISTLENERDFLSSTNEKVWTQQDPSRPSTPAVQGIPGFDPQGKLNRKIWMLEQQLNSEATKRNEERSAHMLTVEYEQSVAAGLRERVGKLEGRVRDAQRKVDEVEAREKQGGNQAAEAMAVIDAHRSDLQVQLRDLKESWEKERADKRRVEEELGRVKTEKMEVEAELRLVRDTPAHQAMRSPGRVLQPQLLNVERSRVPTTPTKSRMLAAHPVDSANPFVTSPTQSPTTSLARRFAYLEERHALLKAEYDRLRAKYQEDLRHWKEYKAVETARIDLKKQRRAERRQERPTDTTPHVEEIETQTQFALPADVIYELVAASDGSQSLPQRQHIHGYVQEPTQIDHASSATAGRSSQMSEGQYDEAAPEIILPSRRPVERTRSASTPPRSPPHSRVHAMPQQDKVVYEGDFATPTARRAAPATGKVSAWLGHDGAQHPPSASTRCIRNVARREEDNVFGDESIAADSPTVMRSPLIRDRGATTSLRHSALRKTVSVLDASTSTPGWGDPTDSTKKRKHIEIEAMSPVQKAAELKRLNKMTGREKREYYAEYKGKGRYLPPEEVRAGVFEEFEIDPKENEGHNFQFHDVKRGKEERKQMHGGDCECCQGYYEAVGHIPRYNEAPKWNDTASTKAGETSLQAEMQEHQNKVSRHRETWRRPPTPPGYWSIGFPTTQDVKAQNERADEMVKKREAEVRRDAASKDSKWKKKG